MAAGNSGENVNQTTTRKDRVDQATALLWVLAGLVVFIGALGLEYKAEFGPGSGFLPFWLGAGLMGLGFVLLAQVTWSRKEKERLTLPPRGAAWQMVIVMLVFFLFAFFAEKVGFLFCIGLMFVTILVFVEKRGWKFSLAMAVIFTLIFWAVFEWGLSMRLPPGLLELLR